MKVLMFLGGFALGAAVAGGVVLLLVPRSGADTRQAIRDRVDQVMEEGRQAAEVRRQQLLHEFETLKEGTPAPA